MPEILILEFGSLTKCITCSVTSVNTGTYGALQVQIRVASFKYMCRVASFRSAPRVSGPRREF